jgi:pilus assembly protein CpaF
VPAAPARPAEPDMTHQLKVELHKRLLKELDLKHSDLAQASDDRIRHNATETVTRLIGGFRLPAGVDRDRLLKDVINEAIGLGPLEELLADEAIDEIMVNNWDQIYVERKGKIQRAVQTFTNNQQVLNTIRRIIAPIGRRIDESSPMVDARLPDGSRVNAIISPLALTGPTLTIRKFAKDPFKASDLVGFGTLSQDMVTFLDISVRHRRNMCISGGTGTGKTTMLNVVSMSIPETERIVTIEDAAELRLPQDHVVSLEAKPPNVEGEGAIPIRKLVINSLRMRPDRIIVGECRGGEALDMLQAMNTGHDGSITTLHANSPRDALARLETMVLMAGMELPVRAIREQIASALNVVAHLSRMTDGTRKMTRICEVTGLEGDVITTQDLFIFKQTGIGPEGKVLGQYQATGIVPRFVHELKTRGIAVDLGIFRGDI